MKRLHHWREVLGKGWWPIGALYALFGLVATVRDNALDPALRARFDTINFIPTWPITGWLAGLAAILLLIALEGSYQVSAELSSELDKTRSDLPRITNVALGPGMATDVEFALHVRVFSPRATSFDDGWTLDLTSGAGVPFTAIPGRVAGDHLLPEGQRSTLTVLFTCPAGLPTRASIVGATLNRLVCTEAHGAVITYVGGETLVAV